MRIKYTAAVTVAAGRREDTKGQTCFICTQALHWKTKEGLVRGARVAGRRVSRTCRAGGAGEDSVRRGRENNLEVRWLTEGNGGGVRLCEQEYHGVVACAPVACWKTYVGGRRGIGPGHGDVAAWERFA